MCLEACVHQTGLVQRTDQTAGSPEDVAPRDEKHGVERRGVSEGSPCTARLEHRRDDGRAAWDRKRMAWEGPTPRAGGVSRCATSAILGGLRAVAAE